MSLRVSRLLLLNFKDLNLIKRLDFRYLSSLPESPQQDPKSKSQENTNIQKKNTSSNNAFPKNIRFLYPEFLPEPNIERRNSIREKLERMDMLKRRSVIDIPNFYVGSILAVTISNPHAQGQTSRFLGICIKREGTGLQSKFILRNVIDNQGIEILYDMYDPKIKKIEVLRLEKRLDDDLLYLRDALPQYSTFPLDMETEFLPDSNTEVPINDIKVKLKPRPWLVRYERMNYKGLQDLGLKKRFYIRAKERETPWEQFDLMKQYRSTIPEEEQNAIYSEVYSQLHQMEMTRKKIKRKKVIVKPKKMG